MNYWLVANQIKNSGCPYPPQFFLDVAMKINSGDTTGNFKDIYDKHPKARLGIRRVVITLEKMCLIKRGYFGKMLLYNNCIR
jgi:hypothetical protein